MLETQQFAPTHGSALRRIEANEAQPTGFLSTDTGPGESPSKPFPDQGITRGRSRESRMNLFSLQATGNTV